MIKATTYEQRRKDISSAALKLIADYGISKFTTASLSTEAGVSEGTIFKYFSNKKDIIDEAILRAEETLFKNFPPQNEDPIEKLGEFFVDRANTALKYPRMVKIVQSEQLIFSASEKGIARLKNMKRLSVNFIKETLEEASKIKRIPDNVSVNVLTFLIFSAIASLANIGDGFLQNSDESVETVWASIKILITGTCE